VLCLRLFDYRVLI